MTRFSWCSNFLGASARTIAPALISATLGCGLSALADPSQAVIQPISSVSFSDPYHVPYNATQNVPTPPMTIMGSLQKDITCPTPNVTPNCGQANSLSVSIAQNLLNNAATQNVTISVNQINGYHPYQMTVNGTATWIMAVTMRVTNRSGDTWSVIAHATPDNPRSDRPPTTWTVDNLIVGQFGKNVDANYDGKYYQNAGQLYLIYQMELNDKPNPHRDGIVALAMSNPTTPSGQPVILFRPNIPGENELESEWYYPDSHSGDNDFKLVETGNIRQINGKFAMAYSVGAYNRTTYKLAVAWADNFLGPYVKVYQQNPDKIWGTTGPEVLYLLQSEKSNWPNYVHNQVLSPGVPTIAQIGQGTADENWVLLFAGYDPGEPQTGGVFDGSHRHTKYVKLDFKVPGPSVTVNGSTNEALKSWLTLHQN